MEKISQTPPGETPPAHSLQLANSAIPVEVTRISDGGIVFFQGGLMNEGTISWYAFDLERRLFIAVLGSAGEYPRHIPAIERLNSGQILRHTDAAGYRRAEFVTLLEATPAQVREFSCLANKLLASESDQGVRPMPADTMAKSFTLLHEGECLDVGAGRRRWEIVGEIEQFIKRPLQEPIMQAL